MSDLPPSGRFSALTYFACLLGLTVVGLSAALVFRPAFAANVKSMLGLETVRPVAAGSFYAGRVEPLFERHCVGCHGDRAAKGQLRLDSLTAAYRGGKHGPVIQPGMPNESELVRRIMLAPTDDRAMPPSGKAPLDKDDVTVIKLWIASGASGDLPPGAIKNAPRLIAPVTIPELDALAAEKARLPLQDKLRQLQARFPDMIDYEARSSAYIEINASRLGSRFGDAQLEALAPLAEKIVRLDLSGTAITDAAASQFVKMKNLRILKLGDTAISNAAISALTQLSSLKSLIVGNSNIGGEALASLRKRGVVVYGGSDGT